MTSERSVAKLILIYIVSSYTYANNNNNKASAKMSFKKKCHFLILPYPIQGHINPMFQFSKRLASKSQNITITILLPLHVSNSVPSQTGSIQVRTISDGSNEIVRTKDITSYMHKFQQAVPKSLDEFIVKELELDQDCHPVVIIYDSILPWALDVAHKHGLLGASFFTHNCFVSSVFYRLREGAGTSIEEGTTTLEGLPKLEMRDLPSFIIDKESSEAQFLLEIIVNQFCNIEKVEFVLFNTFDRLEDEAVKWMAEKCKIKMVGPAIPSRYLDKQVQDENGQALNLFKPASEITCEEWLNSKQVNSVIYIAFGSLAVLKQEQMNQIAQCLKNLQTHFIWVVRESELAKLSHEFMNYIAETSLGQVLTWCNQLDILAHKAVGCFVTHCGWNSTLEALCLGVPMVGIPNWSDQPTNAKLVEHVWRVGVRAKEDEQNGIVSSEELERCVRMVCENGIRRNAEKIREWALEAVQPGGSSDSNIHDFVSKIAPS